MNTFEWRQGRLFHFYNGEQVAVVQGENVDAYRAFVPEAPEVPAGLPGNE